MWRRSTPLLCTLLGATALLSRSAAAESSTPAAGRGAPVGSLLGNDQALAGWLSQAHPDVAAARADVAQSRAAVGTSRALPNPVLDFEVSGITLGQRNPSSLSPSETRAYTVGLSETIELGKRGPRIRAAELRHRAAEQSYRDALAAHVEDARDALARVVYYNARQNILDERLSAARDVVKLEQTRLEKGDISGIDQDRLVLDSMSLEREDADNRADFQGALSDCAAALAAQCTLGDAGMDAVDRAAPAPAAPPDASSAVAGRPDIRALHLASQAASEDASLWRRQAIPDPTIGVAYTRDYLTYAGNQPNTVTVSVSLPLPIFDHGHYQAAQAQSQSTELELTARAKEARARADVASLLSRRSILQRKLDSLVKQSVPHATAVLRAMQQAYQHGQISMTDLLLVRREHVAVLLDLTDTRFELFTIRNQLRRVLGLDAAELGQDTP
jgi:cobalt-zinc-cadmium efflux system outer membrane protein